ncbi:MAG: NapC/NirT family cytochrome c [Terriglobia bacterium]
MLFALTASFIGLTICLALLAGFRPELTRSTGGKIFAFAALAVAPGLSLWGGFEAHLDRATSTQFCLSCHVMEDFGRSLHYDDRSYLPATHYQNNFVPRDHACYTCHTDYAMFGGVKAKFRGLQHIYVQYLGTIPQAKDIKLYEPFSNKTCLHCHLGARKFEEVNGHHKAPDTLARAKSGAISCISSGCHDTIHDVTDLKGATFWKGTQ